MRPVGLAVSVSISVQVTFGPLRSDTQMSLAFDQMGWQPVSASAI